MVAFVASTLVISKLTNFQFGQQKYICNFKYGIYSELQTNFIALKGEIIQFIFVKTMVFVTNASYRRKQRYGMTRMIALKYTL